MSKISQFTQRKVSGPLFLITAMVSTFGAYFCVYAFRKSFAAAQYEDASDWHEINFKIAIIVAQVIGYALSKFVGIKLISEMKPHQRPRLLIGLVLLAELALVAFGFFKDAGWSLFWLFLNGLALGMMWGIVFSYIEGRRSTELLGAVLCSSFIISSGAVKSVGSWLMNHWAVQDYWMPATTGLLFLGPLFLFTLLLEKLPAPTPKDQAQRTRRDAMDGTGRRQFFWTFSGGLIPLIICYTIVTAYRDFRDNFAAELWTALDYDGVSYIFTLSELPIAFGVLIMLAACWRIQSNGKAFLLYHAIILAGCLLVGIATFMFQLQLLRGDYWMVLVGAGLYMAYVPFNAILFDRMIAAFRYTATAGFLIYVADSWGYVGSVSILLYKNFGQTELNWLEFFVPLSYGMAGLGSLMTLGSWAYFAHKLRVRPLLDTPAATPQP